jgi:hypothetical protein
MIEISKQRGQQISPDLEVRNRTNAEVQVTQQYGEVRINLAKVKPPVIITLSPGKAQNGPGKA